MITFSTPISETQLLTAHNNNIVVFTSDLVKTPAKAEITIGTNMFTYYPHPNRTFYVNFLEWFNKLINIDNYTDDLNPDLTTAYVYDWTAKSLLELSINFKITFTDNFFEDITKTVKVLNASVQEEYYKRTYPLNSSIADSFPMTPYQNSTLKSVYVKMWRGMPFDLTMYTGTATDIEIVNISNLLDATFPVEGKVNRIVFCDGALDTSITDVLSLANGYNRLTINGYDLLVEVDDSICDGVYLKWINEQGGYSYWMFPKGERSRPIKSLGVLNNDFKNVQDTTSPAIQLGKRSNDMMKFTSDTLTEDQNLLVKTLFDSTKVYLFTGVAFELNTSTDWLEVEVNNNSVVVERAKTTNNEYQISIDLPRRNTRTL